MTTAALVNTLLASGQDFEWYPTTQRMIDAIRRDLGTHTVESDIASILDIGAGDGRVLMGLAAGNDHAKLYSIEKSAVLQQHQPDRIMPVGCEFFEQNLMTIPVDLVFCNPPYSEFDEWMCRIISTVYTRRLYMIVPQRWEDNAEIKAALAARDAKATIIHRDDFHDAERKARAVVHIVRIAFEGDSYYRSRNSTPHQDPFNVWFDQNIDTFDREEAIEDKNLEDQRLARIRVLDNVPAMVDAFNEEHARMEDHYRAIFRLDAGILRELGVNKEKLRGGLKERIKGLKNAYWHGLFERLDAITSRLTTETKKTFLERLTGQTSIAFTASNAYAVVLWAIKAANKYFDGQLITLFRALSTFDGVANYTSNQRTWVKDGWRYSSTDHSHYRLDYRIVLRHYRAIRNEEFGSWEYPGDLHTSCHEIIDDVIAVLGNLGFLVSDSGPRQRTWRSNQWQDFKNANGETLFQVKAFINGNMHFRFDQRAIKALNIEAGRLLGWVRTTDDVVKELGYSVDEASAYFGRNQQIGAGSVKLLASGA